MDNLKLGVEGIQRLSRWPAHFRINVELTPDGVYRLEFSFRADLSQLPRPFQIGVTGQSELRRRSRAPPRAAARRACAMTGRMSGAR
jgi:hypothetical protein